MRQLRSFLLATSLLLWVSGAAQAAPSTGLVISELLWDAVGSDNNKQWVEIHNSTGAPVNLATYSLGWGRTDYTQGVFQLTGIIPDGATWVIGGPTSDATNGFPVFTTGLASDFAPNLRAGTNNGSADGVALFNLVATSITPTSVPIHAIIYGRSSAGTTLLNESGAPGSVLFITDGFTGGNSIEFWGGNTWLAQGTPTPGSVPASIPEPGTAALVTMGLALLCATQRRHSTTA